MACFWYINCWILVFKSVYHNFAMCYMWWVDICKTWLTIHQFQPLLKFYWLYSWKKVTNKMNFRNKIMAHYNTFLVCMSFISVQDAFFYTSQNSDCSKLCQLQRFKIIFENLCILKEKATRSRHVQEKSFWTFCHSWQKICLCIGRLTLSPRRETHSLSLGNGLLYHSDPKTQRFEW